MSRTRAMGDDMSYQADSTVGFDSEGYCLTPGDDNGDTVKKATLEDNFVAVNKASTYNADDTQVRTGEPVDVHMDGEVNVLCKEGVDYTFGTKLYLSDVPGVADSNVDTDGGGTDDSFVGKVAEGVDLTGASGPGLVPVQISGVHQ